MVILAGIVTYNPDLIRLEENVRAVLKQVDRVLVFDNASTNIIEIVQLLRGLEESHRIEINRHDANAGMPLALNSLCARAVSHGANHILLLDQDSVAQEDMLSQMIAYTGRGVGLVSPHIVDRNDAVRLIPEQEVEEVDSAITSGSLVDLEAWAAVGGYDENLFIDWVDHEFCDNLILHGYRILRTNKAVLLHEIGRKEYIGYGWTFEPDKGFFKIPQYSNGRPYIRRYDMIRGQAYTAKKYKGTPLGRHERWMLFAVIVHNYWREKRRFEFTKAMVAGIADGRRLGR